MTNEQFKEIKKRAWAWYRGNMLEWAIKTLRDIANAPEWVKSVVDRITFDNTLNDIDFEKEYKNDIEWVLHISQKRNFGVNYTKEILEFQKALRGNDEYEMIDALCDMIVSMCNAGFGFNAGDYAFFVNEGFHKEKSNLEEEFDIFHTHIEDIALHIRKKDYDPYKCLLETIKELESRTGAWNEAEGKWCKDLGAYTLEEAIDDAHNKIGWSGIFELEKEDSDFWYLGYPEDFGKENDRCYDLLKVKKWYKADYEKCKVGGENA